METASPVLPPFDYVRAATLDEVTRMLLEQPEDVRLFMGGTDLFVQMRDGFWAPRTLIDVKHLPGMQSISFTPAQGLKIGAAVDMNAIARHPDVLRHYPVLVEAIQTVASYQLRSRATMGGNLCNASPAADTAPAALTLEASLVAQGPEGERSIPVAEFFVGPGQHALRPGEFLHRIEIPPPPPDYAGRYLKLGRNTGGDLAIVGVAVVAYPADQFASGYCFKVALASVAPTPVRVTEAEAILAQNPITPETLKAAAKAAREAARPIDDLRGSVHYRRAMVETLAGRALADVWDRVSRENQP